MATFDFWVAIDGVRVPVRFTKAQAQALARATANAEYFRVGYKLIPCTGHAHSNAHIDNCGMCAPRWGFVEVPEQAEATHAR